MAGRNYMCALLSSESIHWMECNNLEGTLKDCKKIVCVVCMIVTEQNSDILKLGKTLEVILF